MINLYRNSILQIKSTSLSFKRYLYKRIDWQYRLIGIKGARGIGKTTLLLQYLKAQNFPMNKAIFISLDNIYFTVHKLVEFADEFVANGGELLVLDEVHKYPNWSVEVKNIYDIHKNLRIIFTSSSAIAMEKGKADLSRRAAIYTMNEMSLREFVELTLKIKLPVFSLEDVIKKHNEISLEISEKIKPLIIFAQYLQKGAYPFITEGETLFQNRLKATTNQIIEVDLPAIVKIEYSSIYKLKKLLKILAETPPFKPNISELSEKIETSRDRILLFLHYLNEAQLIKTLHRNSKGMSYLSKPEKIYIHNSTLLNALCENSANIGTVREIFFLNQLSAIYEVNYPQKGDFSSGKYTFEIGGKNKTRKQIIDIPNSFVVADDIEFGINNKIPLWVFGFLY